MNVSRDDLQHLADQPLGSPHLQKEAERNNGMIPPSAELKEMCKRISKKFLPLGKKPFNRKESEDAKQAFYARQIDIEDAVEAAGGKRGGKAENHPEPRTPLLTVAKHNREYATLYRGQFASDNSDGYSLFRRKRDAEAFADFLASLFGNRRLETMDIDAAVRPTPEEREAMRAELQRLQGA